MADYIIKPDSGGNQLILQDDGGGDALTIETDQDVKINAGDIYFGTAGKGIVLGATSNVDANTLDDYEEGTHTPTLSGTSGGTPTAQDHHTWRYIKIGSSCHVQGLIYINSVSGASGSLAMSLPFTSASNTTGTGMPGGWIQTSQVDFAGSGASWELGGDSTTISILSVNDASGSTALCVTGYYRFSFTYSTAT